MNYQSKSYQLRNNPTENSQPINKHVAALITFIVLLPLVYYVPSIVEKFLPDSKWLNVITAVGIIVPIISYVVIPLAGVIYSKLNEKLIEEDMTQGI